MEIPGLVGPIAPIGPTPHAPHWAGPSELVVVRHGESIANAAFASAEAVGRESTGISGRDADIPLSRVGEAQSAALGTRLAQSRELPEMLLCSPYRRARDTARIAVRECAAVGRPLPRPRRDERLRDREMGVLELLTATAIERRHPAEARRRARVGDFYYRPPGGESLADVALRLRGVLADLRVEAAGRRVLVVAHDAVVLMLRYLLEDLSEPELLRVARSEPVATGSVSRWKFRDGQANAVRWSDTSHLRPAGEDQPPRHY